MDRFDDLAAFVAVAELKSFSAAARRLRISASAATRAVAALEAHLGLSLLHRTTRSVSPTDAGQRYLLRARAILSDIAEADDAARAERHAPVGRFVLAAPETFGRLHVGPLMCDFLSRNRGVTGELLLSDRVANLVEDGIDAAVRIGALPDSSLVVRKLGRTRRVVVAAPAYLKQHGKPAKPEELAKHRIARFAGIGGANEWRFWHKQREKRVAIHPHYTTNSADAALWHAMRGGGLTMVLAYQAAEAIRDKRLQIVLAEFEPPPAPIQFVYPAARQISAKIRSFVDLAIETTKWEFVDL